MEDYEKGFHEGFKEAAQMFINSEGEEFVRRTLNKFGVHPDFIEECLKTAEGLKEDSLSGPCRNPDEYYCPGYGCVSGSCPP